MEKVGRRDVICYQPDHLYEMKIIGWVGVICYQPDHLYELDRLVETQCPTHHLHLEEMIRSVAEQVTPHLHFHLVEMDRLLAKKTPTPPACLMYATIKQGG